MSVFKGSGGPGRIGSSGIRRRGPSEGPEGLHTGTPRIAAVGTTEEGGYTREVRVADYVRQAPKLDRDKLYVNLSDQAWHSAKQICADLSMDVASLGVAMAELLRFGYRIDRKSQSYQLLQKWPIHSTVDEALVASRINLIKIDEDEDLNRDRFGKDAGQDEDSLELRPPDPEQFPPEDTEESAFVGAPEPSSIPEDDRLVIADIFVLPAKDTVTQTIGILAKKDSGKTYTGLVMAEEMARLNLPFAVLDPTGVWWGLRSGADGLSGGYNVLVVGGDKGDFELLPDDGSRMAALVVDRWRKPTIIDLSLFSPEEQHIFVAAFGSKLYAINRRPLHLFIDEADEFAPQKPESPLQKTVLAVIDRIIRRGRRRGIGCSMFTQRNAVINKNVISQVDMLIAMCAVAPADLDAIQGWISRAVSRTACEECLRELPKLQKGEAYVVASGKASVFRRIKVRLRTTFDSSRTPGFDDVYITDPILCSPGGLEEAAKLLGREAVVLTDAPSKEEQSDLPLFSPEERQEIAEEDRLTDEDDFPSDE